MVQLHGVLAVLAAIVVLSAWAYMLISWRSRWRARNRPRRQRRAGRAREALAPLLVIVVVAVVRLVAFPHSRLAILVGSVPAGIAVVWLFAILTGVEGGPVVGRIRRRLRRRGQ